MGVVYQILGPRANGRGRARDRPLLEGAGAGGHETRLLFGRPGDAWARPGPGRAGSHLFWAPPCVR